MAEYRSPSGEVLDIPAKGVHVIAALGWVPTAKKETKPEPVEQAKTAKPKPSTSKE